MKKIGSGQSIAVVQVSDVEVGNYRFYIIGKELDYHGKRIYGLTAVAAQLLDRGNQEDLITGFTLVYRCSIKELQSDVDVHYSVICNSDIHSLTHKIWNDPEARKILRNEALASNALDPRRLSDETLIEYAKLYPDYPVLQGRKEEGQVELNFRDFAVNEGNVSRVSDFVDFLARGTLVSDKELAVAMSEVAKKCIPVLKDMLAGTPRPLVKQGNVPIVLTDRNEIVSGDGRVNGLGQVKAS